MEVIRRAGDVADLDIVVCAQLQEAFETRGAVFRSLAFIAVRQQHHEAVGAQPLDLAAGDELIDHDLRAIGEIAELRFPHRQGLGVRHGEAVFEAEHAIFGQDAVIDFELAVRQRGEGNVLLLVFLIDPDGVPLAERAAPRILARKAHAVSFGDEAAESERFGSGPVEPFAAGEHLLLGLEDAAQRLVDRQIVGHRGERAAETVEQLLLDRGLDIAARGFGIGRLVEARPASAEPVRLVGLVILGSGEIVFQPVGELAPQLVGVAAVDHAFVLQTRAIQLAHLGMLADFLVHQRLGEARLVALVMTEAAIAPHVDHDIAPEGVAVFDRQLAGEGDCLGIVAVDVQDRRLDALGNVRGIGARPCELGRGGKADLVVDDEVDAAAGVVAAHARQTEAFPHDALARKGGIAVDQHGQYLLVLLQIVADGLLRARLAQYDRIDRFEMGRVGDQRHVHRNSIEFTVGAGAEVVFHIARTADIVGIGAAARKFVEDDLVRLGHYVREHVQPAAMRHAVNDLAHARLAAIFDDGFESGDHRFPAIEAEALGPDIFLGEELLELLASDHGGQDGALAFVGELDRLAGGFDAVLKEAALLHIGDVHVFEADIAAIDFAQPVVEIADGHPAEAEHAADEDFEILLPFEPVPGEREIFRQFAMREAERIEIGGQMPTHAEAAHQHHGAVGIVRRLFERLVVHWLARRFRGLLDRELHLRGIERLDQIRAAVRHFGQPVRIGPARPGLRPFLIAQFGDEGLVLVTHCHSPLTPPMPGWSRRSPRTAGYRSVALTPALLTSRRAWCRARWARG